MNIYAISTALNVRVETLFEAVRQNRDARFTIYYSFQEQSDGSLSISPQTIRANSSHSAAEHGREHHGYNHVDDDRVLVPIPLIQLCEPPLSCLPAMSWDRQRVRRVHTDVRSQPRPKSFR